MEKKKKIEHGLQNNDNEADITFTITTNQTDNIICRIHDHTKFKMKEKIIKNRRRKKLKSMDG